jgi:hypothetical protein
MRDSNEGRLQRCCFTTDNNFEVVSVSSSDLETFLLQSVIFCDDIMKGEVELKSS